MPTHPSLLRRLARRVYDWLSDDSAERRIEQGFAQMRWR